VAMSEGEKRAAMGIVKVSMEACTKIAISTLPLVLLKTHVTTVAKAMAMTTNLAISRKPLHQMTWPKPEPGTRGGAKVPTVAPG
jgi:hypothetical protein